MSIRWSSHQGLHGRVVLGIIPLEHFSMSLPLPVRAFAYIYVDRENVSFDSDSSGYFCHPLQRKRVSITGHVYSAPAFTR
jgi:hypothetical protein